jgi:hypothetical protein
LTIAESIRLNDVMSVENNKVWERALKYHDRIEQVLNAQHSQVQTQLNELSSYAQTNQRKINHKKSIVMLFNTSNKNDFSPELKIDGVLLEVVKELKLLGVIITSDLKWHRNTENITKKAYKRLWILKRLKQMGASTKTLIDIYAKHVRSVLEFAAVVWSSSLTKENIMTIERVQKSAFAVIIGSRYESYEEACVKLNMETLSKRREKLSLKFATKSYEHEIHTKWFVPNQGEAITRSEKPFLNHVQGRTERLLKSAIPYLTTLLNKKMSSVPL